MIECPNCRAQYPENTLFCTECGEYLGEDRRDTEALMNEGLDRTFVADERIGELEQDDTLALPGEITLLVGQLEHEVKVALQKQIMLGRLDPTTGSYPDVDLTDLGGIEQGVSRQHARISCPKNDVQVEDLGSVNGSFVNGKPLTPYLAHPLRNGDLLCLGKMKIKIVFHAKNVGK